MANVHASDESSTTLPAWTEPLLPFFKALIPAVAVGVITSILGYLRTTPPESFDGKKVTATVIISAIIGTITVITGWTYEQSVEWFANAGLTVWVYWLISVIAVKLKWGTVNSTPPPATT
jgi:hypothetical protein